MVRSRRSCLIQGYLSGFPNKYHAVFLLDVVFFVRGSEAETRTGSAPWHFFSELSYAGLILRVCSCSCYILSCLKMLLSDPGVSLDKNMYWDDFP